MPDLRGLLAEARQHLGDAQDAEHLLLHALRKPRSWLFAHAQETASVPLQDAYADLVRRRASGEPVAYITGRRGFWSLDLEVTPATLIPRPETELLVELALAHLPEHAPRHVLDLGTGSGAVALSLARERPRAKVCATDSSAAALDVARRNAQQLGIGNVEFVHGDWFAPLPGRRFALIVSNPPYIETADAHLTEGDLRFEPMTALASGVDGLQAIRIIVAAGRNHLAAGGWLLFEHGWNQGAAAREALHSAGYRQVFTALDLEQRERVSGGSQPD